MRVRIVETWREGSEPERPPADLVVLFNSLFVLLAGGAFLLRVLGVL